MDEIALGHRARGATHPRQHDIGLEGGDRALQRRAGAEIERAAEFEFDRIDAGRPQQRRPSRLAANDDALHEPRARERDRQALEKTLGAAVAAAGHRLQEPRHWRSSRALRWDSKG